MPVHAPSPGTGWDIPSITDGEFARFADLIRDQTGIHLRDHKRQLLVARLGQRPAGKLHRLQSIQVGGYAAKRNRHAVEVKLTAVVVVKIRGQKLVDSAIGEECIAQMRTLPEAEGKALRNFAAVLAPAVAGFGVGGLQRKDPGKTLADCDGA